MPVNLTGAAPRNYSAAYGGIPTVADPREAMRRAIQGDIGSLANLYNLSTGVSNAAAAGARTQYQANLPMYTPLTNTASANIMANLRGQVAPDVINLLRQQGAESGVGFGPDSPATNAAYLRALGLTSSGLQNLGQQQLTAAIGRTPVGPMFNPASMLTSPEDMQAAQMAANMMQAAPDPGATAAESQRLAREGLRMGAGTGGGLMPVLNQGGGVVRPPITSPGVVVGQSPGTGTSYGGQIYYGGANPTTFTTSDWLASIGLGGTAGGGGYDNWAWNPMDEFADMFENYWGEEAMGYYGNEDNWAWNPIDEFDFGDLYP